MNIQNLATTTTTTEDAVSAQLCTLSMVSRKGRKRERSDPAHYDRGFGPKAFDRTLAVLGNRTHSRRCGIEGLNIRDWGSRRCFTQMNQVGNVIVVRQG